MPYALWCELPTGVMCKLYSLDDYVHAYLDFRIISSSSAAIREVGTDMTAEVDGLSIELQCSASICLLTVTTTTTKQ